MFDYPKKQGLYDPKFEHDACGIGAIANIKGVKSHDIIKNALNILIHLEHRGGAGAEDNTGDGAGILFQIPHEFFKAIDLGFELPSEGEYAVAMIFLSQNEEYREYGLKAFKEAMENNNLKILGERKVPYNTRGLGKTAIRSMPYILQIFVKKPEDVNVGIDFERKLYIARRNAEKIALERKLQDFYICSFSSRTIVYKGMLLSTQVENFYIDLMDTKVKASIALVHSRFSTNTFPSWNRAHPNRFLCHNGEINTIRGNVNSVKAREGLFKSEVFGDDLKKVLPVIAYESSDSAMFDNFIEFLYMNGRTLEEAIMLTIPEPWTKNAEMDKDRRAFYEFQSTMMEPWDGPASMIFTDGIKLGASLDRNGLRPSRYCITKDNNLIIYSETGALPIAEDMILEKARLEPGKLLLVDTKEGKVISNDEIKDFYAHKNPYKKWNSNLVKLSHFNTNFKYEFESKENLKKLQDLFGYTKDEIQNGITYMANNHEEKIVAMGVDTPLAALCKKSKLLYDFFKQNFAQVTNPPIDAIREEIVTSSRIYLGREGNLLHPDETCTKRVKLDSPILTNEEMHKVRSLNKHDFKVVTLSLNYNINNYDLKTAINELCLNAHEEAQNDAVVIILSDKGCTKDLVSIPALLACSAVHNYLNERNSRTHVSLILETAEAREIHHMACLIGYGVTAINPYLAFETINDLCGSAIKFDYDTASDNYVKALNKGIIKIMSKMGISTIQSYNGAQIFETLGLNDDFVNEYFPKTTNSVSGIGLEEIEEGLLERHYKVYNNESLVDPKEDSLMEKEIISLLQDSCKNGDYKKFREYCDLVDSKLVNIRDLMEFDTSNVISIDEVESVESIVKRFKTGAMSYGAISEEAHECLAMAMNKIGGRSNCGEGGEINDRYYNKSAEGYDRSSAIKQVASGRFGVTMEYLTNAKEIQIKCAQGAKPGEGGQLPAKKVFPSIARARHSTPGVTLISPPPHHDIYSIEDLAQLIYDLKNANREAEIGVKLVSEAGVGTVASGVVKAGANKVLISGFDGGTGAAPRTSVPNAGMPWEVGLSEAHQTLVLNNLRDRVKLETDGKLLTGRDVAIAALLGADEFGFATAPLLVCGCKMLRVCNLNTCPFGVATQKEELRKKFSGKVDDVVNFMYFIAEDLREYMAQMGFRTVSEMVGRVDKIKVNKELTKKYHINIDKLLYNPVTLNKTAVCYKEYKPLDLEKTLDERAFLPICKDAIENNKKTIIDVEINNVDRSLGTILSSEITKKHPEGLPHDTITINAYGNAGNSVGAFLTSGVTINITGDANDYLGKGLCGGKLIVKTAKNINFYPEENIIAGNVILYGATKGEVYLEGIVGERFCVRNSGAYAIALGCGQHGCEYMTGGRVIILGDVGPNFASGMSGGIAYVYGKYNLKNVNMSLVEEYPFDEEDKRFVYEMIKKFVKYTDSKIAKTILKNFNAEDFVKLMPRDYKNMTDLILKYKDSGSKDPEYDAFLEATK